MDHLWKTRVLALGSHLVITIQRSELPRSPYLPVPGMHSVLKCWGLPLRLLFVQPFRAGTLGLRVTVHMWWVCWTDVIYRMICFFIIALSSFGICWVHPNTFLQAGFLVLWTRNVTRLRAKLYRLLHQWLLFTLLCFSLWRKCGNRSWLSLLSILCNGSDDSVTVLGMFQPATSLVPRSLGCMPTCSFRWCSGCLCPF